MSDNLTPESRPATDEAVSKSTSRAGLGGLLKGALESLVTAQHRSAGDNDPLLFRFPPV